MGAWPDRARAMAQLDEDFRRATELHRRGDLAAAERLYQSVLTQAPLRSDALHLFGLLRLQQGRPADALPLLERALAAEPRSPEALANAAGALIALGRPAEALQKLDALVALRPADAAVAYNRGVVLEALRRDDEAALSYRQALRNFANHGPAQFNLGNLLAKAARYDEAVACYDKVLALAPGHRDALNNAGNALAKLGRHAEALSRFDRALARQPNDPRTLLNRASALKELRRYGEALADYQRALELDPNSADAHYNLGNALIDLGRPEEAVQNFRRALALAPDLADAHTSLIFALNFVAASTAAEQQAERAAWAKRYAALSAAAPPHPNGRDPERRLRVGYVSPYFRGQAATYAFGGVIVHHDRDRFEVLCYSDTQSEDDVTERLKGSGCVWRRTEAMSDEALAALISDDGIDILVDLVGHMKGHRLPLFARKPAPVEVTAWGEPTGTGLRGIDYLLADPVLVPEAERALLAERVFDLPNFLGFWTPVPLPEPGPLAARGRGAVTFGSFNRFAKVLPAVLRAWAQILRAVPDARLVLKDRLFDAASQRTPMLAVLAQEGIAPERVSFLDQADRAAHFAAYREIDIALDPFPHGGGMTTLDALWMGVPVVTMPGRTISSRLAAASLTALGLTDLVAPDLDRYVSRAKMLAADLEALAGLRASLRPRLQNSAIGDPVRYTRAVETAYREMWRRWCAAL